MVGTRTVRGGERGSISLGGSARVAGAIGVAILLFSAGATPRDPDTLVVGIGTDPGSLDPARVTGVPEGRVLRALFEGLTTADPDTLAPLPGAATEWTVSPDGRRIRFALRPGNRWSNGEPLTSEDFRGP